jgi:transcriptional regulator GlxA family with amidase domain
VVTTRRQRVVCCLFDGFLTLDVVLFCSVLASAGQRWNHRAFEVVLAARRAGPIDGVPSPLIATATLGGSLGADIVFVPGGSGIETAGNDSEFVQQLGALVNQATKLCATGTAQLLLARSSHLPLAATAVDGSLAPALEALGQGSPAVRDLHGDDRYHTAAHSLAALPLALDVVRAFLGRSEADAVAAALGQRQRALLLGIKP